MGCATLSSLFIDTGCLMRSLIFLSQLLLIANQVLSLYGKLHMYGMV
jgi:hypothetical protein